MPILVLPGTASRSRRQLSPWPWPYLGTTPVSPWSNPLPFGRAGAGRGRLRCARYRHHPSLPSLRRRLRPVPPGVPLRRDQYTSRLIRDFTALYRACIGGCVAGQGDVMIGAARLMARTNDLDAPWATPRIRGLDARRPHRSHQPVAGSHPALGGPAPVPGNLRRYAGGNRLFSFLPGPFRPPRGAAHPKVPGGSRLGGRTGPHRPTGRAAHGGRRHTRLHARWGFARYRPAGSALPGPLKPV